MTHPRNKHRGHYEFDQLIKINCDFRKYVITNRFNGALTIDFSNPDAVVELNRTLLKYYYRLDYWDIPKPTLCPPIPGRADYIHHLKDLLGDLSDVVGLDIGTGASCIYPLVGHFEYGWKFVASEIDPLSTASATKNINNNKLDQYIEIRHQKSANYIFKNIIKDGEYYHFSMCNPPFHQSKSEALKTASIKTKNLKSKQALNFGGRANELWCDGGEVGFIKRMILESADYKNQVKWFTTLVSKKNNLSTIYGELKRINLKNVKTIEMAQGNKISRFVAWSFN